MIVKEFFDKATSTLTYIVYDQTTKDAVLIDPVLDFDQPSGNVTDQSVQLVKSFILEHQLKLHYIFETHVHADHLSSSHFIKKLFPLAKLVIGARITEVQKTFHQLFNLDSDIAIDGSQFDILAKENDLLQAGSFTIKILETPGHTPACLSLHIGNFVFTGDALFVPDSGTGRCDFPNGTASGLYHSIHQKLYQLPDETLVYVGHDYQPGGRELKFQTTIGESKKSNIHLKWETLEKEYIEFRQARDKTLSAPKLLLPSLQINMNGGKFPKPETNGVSYLKLPLKIKF